mmetsp:Transcript_9884/g.16379  ORF Transcript_9884/g.16379 Transcript_9884/m.16379 type:complete len:463 (-) Transcript_9884:56-1444(-)
MAKSPVMADPFSQALRSPDIMEKLAAMPDTRKHLADPGFIEQIEKLRAIATDPTLDPTDFMKQAEVGQKIARAGHHDPRIMQALMGLQGMGLTVDEKDMKRAEDQGDMPRREPVQLEQLYLVKDISDAGTAKARGNEFFKKGDFNAALAHYERGVECLKAQEEASAAALATLLSNGAQCLLKLKWPDRAKKNASMAIAAVRQAGDESFDQSKLFYRRALACEQMLELSGAVDDMLRALQQAKKSGLDVKEQHRLKAEAERLKKLKASHEEAAEQKRKHQEGEKTAEVQRMQGTKLKEKEEAKVAVPSESYIKEQDFSHLARKKVMEALDSEIRHKSENGTEVVLTCMDEANSKVEASIVTKQGSRSLYYEMDLSCKWKGKAAPKLKPAGEDGELLGVIRVYNIAHDTKFELGGDQNTSYMYALGWDQRKKGDWVEDLRVEAAELFDLIAAKVDAVISELKKK